MHSAGRRSSGHGLTDVCVEILDFEISRIEILLAKPWIRRVMLALTPVTPDSNGKVRSPVLQRFLPLACGAPGKAAAGVLHLPKTIPGARRPSSWRANGWPSRRPKIID